MLDWNASDYRAQEILEHVQQLTFLVGRRADQGVASVMRTAVSDVKREQRKAIILCRLLFSSKSGEALRGPRMGAPLYIGGTLQSDWPLEPVAVFRGVPFLIVRGYTLAGGAEPAAWYLSYCLRYGVWAPDVYRKTSNAELQEIAEAFIESGPWRTPLNEQEQRFIRQQVA